MKPTKTKKTETTFTLAVSGMTCTGCELRIETALGKIPGVSSAKADHTKGTVQTTCEPSLTDRPALCQAIEALGYRVQTAGSEEAPPHPHRKNTFLLTTLILFFLTILLSLILSNTVGINSRTLQAGSGYSVLFLFGLITSIHCLFMCGSINLAVCASSRPDRNGRFSRLVPGILYNAGRTVTCTAVGGIVGGIGSIIQPASGTVGIVSIAAGIFMMLIGLKMLNRFPALHKFIPHMPKKAGHKVLEKIGKSDPFVIGLLNGLMPCGALQSMQFYALGTGSWSAGALSMLFFCLGTVPLMFGLGTLGSALSERFTQKAMKAGACIIIIMGLFMLIRGIVR